VLPLTRDAFRLVGTLGHGAWFLGKSCQHWRLADQLPHRREGDVGRTAGSIPMGLPARLNAAPRFIDTSKYPAAGERSPPQRSSTAVTQAANRVRCADEPYRAFEARSGSGWRKPLIKRMSSTTARWTSGTCCWRVRWRPARVPR
jgi:hypothetical protein